MERESARYRLNSQPVLCSLCNQQNPNYRMLIDTQGKLLCVVCSLKSKDNIRRVEHSYKDYCQALIKKLPLPDCKIAKECLQTIETLKKKTNSTLTAIRHKLDAFQNDLKAFYEQTTFICQGYLDKLKNIQESPVNSWHKHPPKLIDQEKYIFNIKQKQILSFKIEESLKELQLNLPHIEDIKKEVLKNTEKVICKRVCLTSVIKIRGVLYLGTNDGRIIIEHLTDTVEIKAHDSQIRAFEHDGQFKLYSSSDDQTIKIWDIRGELPKFIAEFGTIPHIKSSHRELALLDGGKCLASTRGQFDEYKIRIWDLQNYQNCKTLVGHTGYLKGMLVTDSNQLISVSQDRYLRIWDLKSCLAVSEYYHWSRINYLDYNQQSDLICIVDDLNKILLLDAGSLAVYSAVWVGKKILMAKADSFIYVHTDRHIFIYSWNLCLVEKIESVLSYSPTNIVEMVNRLVLTDANGTLHELTPQCLKATSL